MSRNLVALVFVVGLSLAPGVAMADVMGGFGGSAGDGGGGAAGDGGQGDGGKDSQGGGCITATPGAATRSAALLLGLGLLLAIPAARSRRSKSPR